MEYTDVQNVLEQIENDAESFKNKLSSTPKQQTQVVEKPSKNEEIFIDVYEIEGTEKQLDMLEDFLNTNGYKWTTIKED